MFISSSFRRRRTPGLSAGVVLTLAILFVAAICASAQSPASAAAERAVAAHGRILLVLPFDNRTGQPSLEWMREAAAELLSRRFRSAGFAPMSREDRIYALDHLGLPEGFQPSRASSLKLAQTLDADFIVVGSYSTEDGDLLAEAQVVDVPHLHMSAPVSVRGKLSDMIALFNSLAWKLTRQLDPSFNVAEETFIAAGRNLRLDAFEQYIRGITEPDQEERLGHLQKAVKLSPDFSAAWMALGREDYGSQQYDQAAEAFAKVDPHSADGLEAGFYRGVSLLFSGDYPAAGKAFAAVARILPLAEVVNNQGVAISRQGHDATALFVQAAADDPSNADYHFNLAVSLKRKGNTAAALSELAQCLKLRPNDSEAQSLQDDWKQPSGAKDAGDNSADPLERIVRSFDANAFRQAAQMLDQMDAAHLASLPPPARAKKLSAQAQGYLDHGLLLEAERLYQAAAAADPDVADAHLGLAQVRVRTGDNAAARKEAEAALKLEPSAGAYLVLAQVDFAAKHYSEADTEAGKALGLDPANQSARELRSQIEARQGSVK